MKTHKNLYPRIYTFENLHTAWRKARAGKRSRVDVAAGDKRHPYEFDMEKNLLELQRELRVQTGRRCKVYSNRVYPQSRDSTRGKAGSALPAESGVCPSHCESIGTEVCVLSPRDWLQPFPRDWKEPGHQAQT